MLTGLGQLDREKFRDLARICVPFQFLVLLNLAGFHLANAQSVAPPPHDQFSFAYDVQIGGDPGPLSKQVDLGELQPGKEGKVTLTLLNRTGRTWQITQTESSCRCAVASLSSATVPSGETTKLIVKLKPRTDSGQPEQVTFVHVHDARARPFSVSLKYRLKNWVAFIQDTYTLQYVRDRDNDEFLQIPFYDTSESRDARLHVESDPELKVSRILSSDERPGQFHVNVSGFSSKASSQQSYHLELVDSTGLRDEAILVTRVVDPVRIIPITLRFLEDPDDPAGCVAQALLVMATSRDEKEREEDASIKPSSVSMTAKMGEKNLMVRSKHLAGGRYRVTLSMSKSRLKEAVEQSTDSELSLVLDVLSSAGSTRLQVPVSLLTEQLSDL